MILAISSSSFAFASSGRSVFANLKLPWSSLRTTSNTRRLDARSTASAFAMPSLAREVAELATVAASAAARFACCADCPAASAF